MRNSIGHQDGLTNGGDNIDGFAVPEFSDEVAQDGNTISIDINE